MIRRSVSPRSAFTLIELLIAIAIIALLAGLLLPAISKVRTFANRTTATSEMTQLAAACTKFQGDWGFYPPSSFTIPTNVNQPGYALLKSKYSRWTPTTDAMGNIIGTSILANAGETLCGNQCVVYFLRGPARAPWQAAATYADFSGWSHDGPYSPTTTSTSAMGPYYTFATGRLQLLNVPIAGTVFFYTGNLPFFADPFGTPYACFSARKDTGKIDPTQGRFYWGPITTAPGVGPVIDNGKPVNEKSMQIICAGENGSDDTLNPNYGFGPGIGWVAGTGAYSSSASGGDDFGNFNGGAPLNRRGE